MRKVVFILCILLMLGVQWPSQYGQDVMATQSVIPDDAIRLRILANSDSPRDQWLKRRVRDDVIAYVTAAADELDSVETSRRWIGERLPHIARLAEAVVRESGFSYPVTVDYGPVHFPTKLYGNRVYPAGAYEAVKITIGRGEGANWWCVLFPPLCFVDMKNADAVSDEDEEGEEEQEPIEESDDTGEDAVVEVRLFLVDWFNRLLEKLKRLA